MPLIFRYFWFVAAGVMLVNVAIWQSRLRALIAQGVITRAEGSRFIALVTGWFVGGSILLGIVALAAKWSSPFCAGVLAFATPAQAIVSIFILAGWISLLWWVWRGGGADFLGRVGPALSQRPSAGRRYSPGVVRLTITAVVLVSGLASASAWRAMPLPPEFTCPVSRSAG